jgi:hypothetical protein
MYWPFCVFSSLHSFASKANENAHDRRRGGHAGADGAGVLATDAVVVEEEPSLDAQPLRVLDRLQRLPDGRDRPDVRPDDGREALLLEGLGEGAGLDDVRVAEEVGTVGRAEDGDVGLEGAGGLALAE